MEKRFITTGICSCNTGIPYFLYITLYIALFAGTAGGLATLLVDRFVFPDPSLAGVDLTTLITEQVTHPSLAHLTDEERARHAARYAARLNMEVERLTQDYNVILLAAPAVVAGVPDLSPVLQTRLGKTDEVQDGKR